MTRFDFDVIGDTPPKPLPNVQKPPVEKSSAPPADAPKADPAKERERAA